MAALVLLTHSKSKHHSDVALRAARAAAGIAGAKLEVKADKEAEDIAKNSLFVNVDLQLPAIHITAADSVVFGKTTILRTIALASPASDLLGGSFYEQSVVESWLWYAFEDIDHIVIRISRLQSQPQLADNKSALHQALDRIEERLDEVMFLGGDNNVTIADLATFAVLFNDTTESSVFEEFGLGLPTSKAVRPSFSRWAHHLASIPSVKEVIGRNGLQPWEGKAIPRPKKTKAAPVQASSGLVWLDSSAQFLPLQDVPLTTVIPALPADAVTAEGGVVFLDSRVHELKQPGPIKYATKAKAPESNNTVDWDKLSFFDQPWPKSRDVVANPPHVVEDYDDNYGDRQSTIAGRLDLQSQWGTYYARRK